MKSIRCRHCGTEIAKLQDWDSYQDPYLSAFSGLCSSCRDKVSSKAAEKSKSLREKMSSDGATEEEIESAIGYGYSHATSPTEFEPPST